MDAHELLNPLSAFVSVLKSQLGDEEGLEGKVCRHSLWCLCSVTDGLGCG